MYPVTLDPATTALTSSNAGLILLDAQNRIVYRNNEALRILAYGQVKATTADSLLRILQSLLRLSDSSIHGFSSTPFKSAGFKSGRRHYMTRSFALAHRSGRPEDAVTGILLERVAPRSLGISAAAEQYRLTPREQETVEMLTLGLTSKEIASRMKISPNTVKAFFRLVMTKMEVSTRSGIVGKIARMQSPA
jgi:DNA-binding CsgD family transcriptional regulator